MQALKRPTMKYLSLILTILVYSGSNTAQTPPPYFYQLLEWGEGGPTILGIKDEIICEIEPVNNGYIFELIVPCPEGPPCTLYRFARVDYDWNVLWQVDFTGYDTLSYQNTNYVFRGVLKNATVEAIVIEDTYYAILAISTETGQRGYIFIGINIETGEITHFTPKVEYDISSYDGGSFFRYKDSLFIYTRNIQLGNNSFVPAMQKYDKNGQFEEEVILWGLWNEDYNAVSLGTLEEREDGLINITYWKRPTGASSGSFSVPHAGVIDIEGNLIADYSMQDHLASLVFPINHNSVTLDNHNRIYAGNIDTSWQNTGSFSSLFKVFLLGPNGNVVKDTTLWDLPNIPPGLPHTPLPDTIISLTDILLHSSGSVIMGGVIETPPIIYDNWRLPLLLKVDTLGHILWRKYYNPMPFPYSQNIMRVLEIEEDLDGGILMTGDISWYNDTVAIDLSRYAFILKVDANGCYGTNCNGGDFLVSTQQPQRIISLPYISYSIFPNPASEYVQLELGNLENPLPQEEFPYKLKIYDIQGNVRFEKEDIFNPQQLINLQKWPAGSYFLQVKTRRQSILIPFFKM